MSLNTFGAIVTFAIDLEGAMQRFYEEAAPVGGGAAETFENYAKKSGKRKQRLVAVRQDNVTEMILEPISGLTQANYEPLAATPTDQANALSEAIRLEERGTRRRPLSGARGEMKRGRGMQPKLAILPFFPGKSAFSNGPWLRPVRWTTPRLRTLGRERLRF